MKNALPKSSTDSLPILTPTHFFQYETHPLWIWYDLFEDLSKKEEISEFALKLMDEGVIHEKTFIEDLDYTEVKAENTEEAFHATFDLMRRGAPLIYQGCIQIERDGVVYRGRPDLLEKREGVSHFGNWHYAPIEIKSSSKIKPLHKHQLNFYSLILEKVQGILPQEMGVINRHQIRLQYLASTEDYEKTRMLSEEILAIMRGNKPPSTITSKSKNSPWFKMALREAEDNRDVSLVYKLDNRSLKNLRGMGIKTLDDLVCAKIDRLPKIPYASTDRLQRAQLQAKALIQDTIIPLETALELPNHRLKLYFDIEGNPLLDIDYLFGIWVSGDPDRLYTPKNNARFYEGEEGYFVYFLAEHPKEEGSMWKAFLEWVAVLPDEYSVYHYANYEMAHIRKLSDQYGGSETLEIFKSNLIDLQNVVEQSAIFPLYFYSIKDLAKSRFINFKWRHQKAGGGQSVFWYDQWLATRDKIILEDIINYNEDDVRATEHLFRWINDNKRYKYC